MPEEDLENEEKQEYSVSKNYNQSLSKPNLNLNSTLGINMKNLDSANLGRIRRRDSILKDDTKENTKKEDDIPKISEVYGNDSSYKEDDIDLSEDKTNKIGEVKTNKVAPEYIVAAITTGLIIVFMILSFVLYNLFTR